MTIKSEAMQLGGFAMSWPMPSFLRIAVPSFGFAMPNLTPEAEAAALSREEIVDLFRTDLRGARKLTDQERRDQDQARRIRAALYGR